MITKEQFYQFLKLVRSRSNFVDELYKLKIDILEADDSFGELEMLFAKTNFTEEGEEMYFYYMYEISSFPKGEDHVWEADGTPVPMNTDDDLWNYLVKNNYLR